MTTLKLCTGPAHEAPAKLPKTEEFWHFHRTGRYAGQPVARCKACTNWSKLLKPGGPHGLVARSQIVDYLIELIDRCGSQDKVAAQYGLHRSLLLNLLRGDQARVQKRTAQRILIALAEQRKLDSKRGRSTDRFRAAVKSRAQSVGIKEAFLRAEHGF